MLTAFTSQKRKYRARASEPAVNERNCGHKFSWLLLRDYLSVQDTTMIQWVHF